MNKKEKILMVSIAEFAEYGFENASTNRMVKKMNISKGSLFQYFNTKEELYTYVIDYVVKRITSEVAANMTNLPRDIFDRLYKMVEIEFDLYVENPIFYKLFKQAISGKSHISQRLIEKYTIKADDLFDNIFQESEFDNLSYDRKPILNLIKWVLTGYNDYFMTANFNKAYDVDKLKNDYLLGIKMYIAMIRAGIDK